MSTGTREYDFVTADTLREVAAVETMTQEYQACSTQCMGSATCLRSKDVVWQVVLSRKAKNAKCQGNCPCTAVIAPSTSSSH